MQKNVHIGLLKSWTFDLTFIIGIFLLAFLGSIVVIFDNSYFELVLTLDLALLGYHHVLSTYSRLVMDGKAWNEHKNLVLYLPLLVIFAVTCIAYATGTWLIATIYLHWQWFHYLRQSDGISKAYLSKCNNREFGFKKLNRFSLYFIPFAAFLNLSTQGTSEFLWMPIKLLPLPVIVVNIINIVALILLIVWLITNIIALNKKKISIAYFSYMISHFTIFICAYYVISNINYGWLLINIWHNAQYIAFVWLFNTNRYRGGVEKGSYIISYFSQKNRFLLYFAFFVIVTSIFYQAVDYGVVILGQFTALPLVIIIYQTINFHHYIVDSLIWKLKKTHIRDKILAVK